jgi:ribosomal-protein-alanine N-acetyltransferase
MNITTDRLELTVLNTRQLRAWLDDLPALERELSCTYCAEPMEGFFREIVAGQLTATEQDPDNAPFHSFWFLIRKSDRTVIGSADFKDVPDANGETEIGYGLGKPYEGNGYMTEAVEAMCAWALGQKGVSHVIAETDLDGLASQRILTRCGFQEYSRGETVWWRR